MPYNYTIYPNYIGHFSQIEAEEDLEPYEAIVDVQCYELASLFLCTLFVPKCGAAGLIPPCKSLCSETMRRCRFFFNVFGLELPDYLSCHQFSDSNNPDICVGQKQMRDAYNRALKPGNAHKYFDIECRASAKITSNLLNEAGFIATFPFHQI